MHGSGHSGIWPRPRTKKDLRAFLGTASITGGLSPISLGGQAHCSMP